MKYFYVSYSKAAFFFLLLLGRFFGASAQISLPDSLFESISQVDPVHARTGNNVLRVSKISGNEIGYQKLIPVKAGQGVDAEVYAYYEKKERRNWVEPISGTAGGLIVTQMQKSNSQVSQGELGQKSKPFPFVGVGIAITPSLFKNIFRSRPKAAVQFNFYNRDSSFIESVVQQITKEAKDQWQPIHLNRAAKEDGFVEIVILNKSEKTVWFDDLIITVVSNVRSTQTGPITNVGPEDVSTANEYRVYVRSFAPPGAFTNKGFDFRDDNRGFSVSESVTSRVKQNYLINPDGANAYISGGIPVSDPTIEASTGQSRTGTPRGQAQITSKNRTTNSNVVRVYTNYEGSNPFYDPFAPDIEVETRITISESYDKTRLTLALTANSKRFPSLEIFIEDLFGTRVFLAVEGAYGGPGDLITRSKNYSTITADVSINIYPSGEFRTVYRTGSISQTYSIQNWNQQFTSQNPGAF